MATISQDLRERIVAAYERGEGTRQQIAERYNVSLGMLKKILRQRRRTENIRARLHLRGGNPSGIKQRLGLLSAVARNQTPAHVARCHLISVRRSLHGTSLLDLYTNLRQGTVSTLSAERE